MTTAAKNAEMVKNEEIQSLKDPEKGEVVSAEDEAEDRGRKRPKDETASQLKKYALTGVILLSFLTGSVSQDCKKCLVPFQTQPRFRDFSTASEVRLSWTWPTSSKRTSASSA
jgi:hypothetical protein